VSAHAGALLAALVTVSVAALPARGAAEATAAGPTACVALLEVRFVESAPRDRFEFLVPPAGPATVESIRLDLAGSVGELVFDTEPGGDGVEVYQPFRVERGEAMLLGAAPLADGGRRVELDFTGFGAGERFTFSIDVDDRLAASELGQIRVSGSEIEGASLLAGLRDADGARTSVEGRFDASAAARLYPDDCAG